MKRKVDRTKKSNIKCEHCRFWSEPNDGFKSKSVCFKTAKMTNYWIKCKEFDWKD